MEEEQFESHDTYCVMTDDGYYMTDDLSDVPSGAEVNEVCVWSDEEYGYV